MCRFLLSCFVASGLGLNNASSVNGQAACRPKLIVTDVQFSEMIPPTLERTWSATVVVDAASCPPNASGYFDLGFSRLKENGYEVTFSKKFVWRAPSVDVKVDFWADE